MNARRKLRNVRDSDWSGGPGAELGYGGPFCCGLGFEVRAHFSKRGTAIAVELHCDDPADPLVHSRLPGGALRQLSV